MHKCFRQVYVFIVICLAIALVAVSIVRMNESFDGYFLSLDNKDDYRSFFRSQWLDPPVSMQMKVHMFNITNKTDEGVWVEEVGPFVYEVDQSKNIAGEDQLFLTYQPVNRFYLDSSASPNVTQVVTTMNVPLFTLLKMVHEVGFSDSIVKVIEAILKVHPSTTVSHPVSQLTFDGYTDALLKLLYGLGETFPSMRKLLDEPKFGLLIDRNNTDFEGNWTVYKGHNEATQAGQIFAWNDLLKTNFYQPGSSCNLVRGSNGEKFKNYLRDDTIYLYLIGDFCTAVPFTFVGESKTLGYATRRYEFKFNDTSLDTCFASEGLHDASPCHRKAPIVFSAPNFSGLDRNFASNIFGLKRQSKENVSFIEVEPRTGVTLKASIKLQANLVIEPHVTNSPLLATLFPFPSNESLVVPLMWVEQTADAQKQADDNLKRFTRNYYVIIAAAWIMFVVFLVVPVTAIYLIKMNEFVRALRARNRSQEQQPLHQENGPSDQ